MTLITIMITATVTGVDITIMITMTVTIIIMARGGTGIVIGTVVHGAIDCLTWPSSSTKPLEHQAAVPDVSPNPI
ncbi:hypothetical protein [Verrucomicrobium sp. BvORR106]|uniref:hypothetical protein n=1 Tax=Verrucomicrobium sp. BvORR106 TaxID=1403819 RepID=UPI00056E5DF7|nr:hypothetical protein [Verrucomicrobium sp. BvORR106]